MAFNLTSGRCCSRRPPCPGRHRDHPGPADQRRRPDHPIRAPQQAATTHQLAVGQRVSKTHHRQHRTADHQVTSPPTPHTARRTAGETGPAGQSATPPTRKTQLQDQLPATRSTTPHDGASWAESSPRPSWPPRRVPRWRPSWRRPAGTGGANPEFGRGTRNGFPLAAASGYRTRVADVRRMLNPPEFGHDSGGGAVHVPDRAAVLALRQLADGLALFGRLPAPPCRQLSGDSEPDEVSYEVARGETGLHAQGRRQKTPATLRSDRSLQRTHVQCRAIDRYWATGEVRPSSLLLVSNGTRVDSK